MCGKELNQDEAMPEGVVSSKNSPRGEDFLNPFPNDKILDQSTLKAFAGENIKVFVYDSLENIVRKKRENAGYPYCFQKDSMSGSLEVGIVW